MRSTEIGHHPSKSDGKHPRTHCIDTRTDSSVAHSLPHSNAAEPERTTWGAHGCRYKSTFQRVDRLQISSNSPTGYFVIQIQSVFDGIALTRNAQRLNTSSRLHSRRWSKWSGNRLIGTNWAAKKCFRGKYQEGLWASSARATQNSQFWSFCLRLHWLEYAHFEIFCRNNNNNYEKSRETVAFGEQILYRWCDNIGISCTRRLPWEGGLQAGCSSGIRRPGWQRRLQLWGISGNDFNRSNPCIRKCRRVSILHHLAAPGLWLCLWLFVYRINIVWGVKRSVAWREKNIN